MSHKAFHQLADGLLAEDKAFVAGKIPDGASLSGKVMRIEAKMHQGDLKKDDPNIQQSLNVILSHYPLDKINNGLIHSAVEKIYAPLIINANPHEASKSEFESYYYDSSSIGSDYGPTQEDMDRLHLEQYREEKEHENKVLGLIDKAYNLSIAKENKSLINGNLELNNKSKGSLEDFKQRCESSKKLPKEVSDPLERIAIKAVDEEIIPQINKLANSKSKNYDINSFIERIDKVLVSAGINDFDKQSAAEN